MLWKRSPCHAQRAVPQAYRTSHVRSRFCILKVLGDVLDDGELRFVETAQTLEAARRRIEVLAAVRPDQSVIYDGETRERASIVAGKRGQSALRDSNDLTGRLA